MTGFLTVLVFLLVGISAGQAAAATSSADAERAEQILQTHYEDFAALPHDGPFDWTTNGCSVPDDVPALYSNVFEPACELHDFGYRNFGSQGLGLRPTEAMREVIDNRFFVEMRRACAARYPFSANPFGMNQYESCEETARIYLWAVRDNGGAFFF